MYMYILILCRRNWSYIFLASQYQFIAICPFLFMGFQEGKRINRRNRSISCNNSPPPVLEFKIQWLVGGQVTALHVHNLRHLHSSWSSTWRLQTEVPALWSCVGRFLCCHEERHMHCISVSSRAGYKQRAALYSLCGQEYYSLSHTTL